MNRVRAWLLGMKVFPLAMAVGAVWGFFSPCEGILFEFLWPLLGSLVMIYFGALWCLGAAEAWLGPANEGQPLAELQLAARIVATAGPLLTLLAVFCGSPATVVVAYSGYYGAVQFLSEHRVTWFSLGLGWFCVLGHSPAVSTWEAVLLYPLVLFVTVGLLRGLLRQEVGLRRSCR